MNFKNFIKLSLLTTLILTPTTQAIDLTDESYAIEVKQNIVNLLKKQKNIFDALDLYLSTGGDIKTTAGEWQNAIAPYLNLITAEETADYFKGLNGEAIEIIFDPNTYTAKQTGVLEQISSNQTLLDIYKKEAANANFTIISSNLYNKISSNAKKIVNLKLTSDPAKVIIANTEPADTTKTWIDTTISGEPITKFYFADAWNTVQKTKNDCYWLEDPALEDTVKSILASGDCVEIAQSDGTYTTKTYKQTTDELVQSASSGTGDGGLFNGTGNITAMATTLFTKAGGSIVDSEAPNGEWGGSKTFTKKDDIATGGYWKTDDNSYVVTNSIESLNALSALFLNGTTAWIANGSSAVYKLQKKTLPDFSEAWVYITADYGTLLSYDTAPNSNGDGAYIYVTDHNEYFYYGSGVFSPHASGAGITYVSKDASGRDIFIPQNTKTYLIQSNDCTALTCNGDAGASYYAGSQIDGLYAYYYSTSGNYKNNLTDASPYTSWATFWTDEASAVQWNGALFGEVPTGAILVKNTLNSATVYSYNGNYVNKANGYIIPQNKLPAGLVATTATITQSGGKNYINVTSLDTFITDTNLDVGYTVNLTGSGFTNKKIERCNDYSDGSQWSDLCTDIAGATVAISNESRSDLVAPNSSSRVNLTKQVGGEANYTTTGVTYTADAGYKQWFYSVTGTITQNMLDGIPCLATGQAGCSNAESVGHGITTSGTYIQYATIGNYGGSDMKLWAYQNGSVLKYNSNEEGIAKTTLAAQIEGKAANGLFYTNTSAPFNTAYAPNAQFGVTTWSTASMTSINDRMNTTNICATRGMRLPTLSETTGSSNPWGGTTYVPAGGSMGNANGVPSHPSGYTWTTTSLTNRTDHYWRWGGTSTGASSSDHDSYVRCVR